MSFIVIFMAFLMGIAGGFLAMHFISVKQDYITKTQLNEGLDAIEHEIAARADEQFMFLRETLADQNARIDYFEKKMNDHYGWSLGIWNDFANLKDVIHHPIPESLQDVARKEVQLSEDELLPMGPVATKAFEEITGKKVIKHFENPTEGIEAAVKMATGIDISDIADKFVEAGEEYLVSKEEIQKAKKCEYVQSEIQSVEVGDKVDIPKPKKKKGKKDAKN